MIAWLIYIFMMLNTFTSSGWLYLVQFNLRFKRKFYAISCICFAVFFLGLSFLDFENYIILHSELHLAILKPRVFLAFVAAVATAVFVYRSNFDVYR